MEHLAQLLYFMAPAYVANMAPPFLKFWSGWNRPISARWLGTHKTVLGFAAGVAAGLATAGAQAAIDWQGNFVDYRGAWPWIGLALGGGALTGDALKSLLKRRCGIAPGSRWIPADQLDFVFGALLFSAPLVHLGWRDIAAIAAVSFAGDVAVNHASFALGIRDTRW